jgi:hypothetical protein
MKRLLSTLSPRGELPRTLWQGRDMVGDAVFHEHVNTALHVGFTYRSSLDFPVDDTSPSKLWRPSMLVTTKVERPTGRLRTTLWEHETWRHLRREMWPASSMLILTTLSQPVS